MNGIEQYENILALEIIKENTGSNIEPEKLQIELNERMDLIKKELEENAIELLPLGYCVLCGSIMKDKKRVTRRIHDIIFHIDYYKNKQQKSNFGR